jgi:hypothetical protein
MMLLELATSHQEHFFMAKTDRFTFLCDRDDRRMLAAIAESLQRSQSDSVRWLIRNAASRLDVLSTSAEAQKGEEEAALAHA